MSKGVYIRTPEMMTGKNPNSHFFKKGSKPTHGFKKGCEKSKNAHSFLNGHKGYKYWLGKKRPDISENLMGDKNHSYGKIKEKSKSWKDGNNFSTRRKYAPRPKPEKCEVCGELEINLKKGLCCDHDHKTGNFRGWICGKCNMALGLTKDNIEILNKLIDYLNKNNEIIIK